ncbi:hypothetical protein CkaCkLH20_05686 [Colletotrichum karsti]|uniref:Major facilitator superfamily (MFS) profile domain-containing protein n=1 Tax=Colletotrichum karsti TaxID=1095194 RepID=A0A9P6LL54_9PEZI|nr:uncharacterized protein CkaCkLH20_05686 [Colletotrichum karsti]KAF9876840.1 hypothetical protein CkaCkLH20_05686 [Colletotrichum karsti]
MQDNPSDETVVGDSDPPPQLGAEKETPHHDQPSGRPRAAKLNRDNTSHSVSQWAKKRLEEHENLPSQSVSWWHPHLAKLRKHTSILWIRNTFIVCLGAFLVLCLYWGIVFKIEENLPSLVCFVVDFDGKVAPFEDVTPLIGPTVTTLANETLWSAIPSIGYQIRPASEFNFDPLEVRRAVYEFKAWSAIVVHSNATSLLQNAVSTGNSSYDPTGAVQVITMSGRDSFMTYSYILPKLTTFTQQLASQFGKTWGDMIMANDSLTRENLQQAASAVNPAISPLMLDLRPFGPPAATPAATFGLSFLIVHFGFTYYLADDQKCIIPEGHPPVHYWHHVIRRWLALMAAYFFLSFAYSLLPLAFQVPLGNPPASPVEVAQNPNAFGKGSFFVFWMLHFLGMAALGFPCENMAMLMGSRWVGLWLTFWSLTNTVTGFWPPDIAPGFYRWSYAWPYHHVFLDRSNIGNARIQGMSKDINLEGFRFNWVLSIFYIVYLFVEVPSNIILKRVGPRFYLPFLVVGFGLVSLCTAFVRSYEGLAAARAFLGVFEGGAMPGLSFFLSSFYRREELLLRIGIFISSASLAGAFGGLLATGLSRVPEWGFDGMVIHTWRNIFFFEGFVTILVGLFAPLWMPMNPSTAYFLTDRERLIAVERLQREHKANADEPVNIHHAKRAVMCIHNYTCAFGFFVINITVQGISVFMPTILNDLGWTATKAQLMSVPPYVVACVTAVTIAYISDKTRQRGIYLAIFSVIAVIGFAILRFETDANIRYMAVFFVTAGAFPGGPGFLSWAMNNSAGPSVRAVTSAYVVTIGTIGGIVATWTYTFKDAPKYFVGHTINLTLKKLFREEETQFLARTKTMNDPSEDPHRAFAARPDVNDTEKDSHDGNLENGIAKHHRKPHTAVGFWDPSMRKVRAHVIRLWLQTILILIAFILGVLSLYWAVLFRAEANLRAIVVHVVDFDGQVAPYQSVQPLVGPTVIQTVQKALEKSGPSLGWTILPPSHFDNDPMAVRQAVYDWDSWAAVIVHANATAALQAAVETGDASYDPAGSLQIIVQSARDSTTYQSNIQPYITQFTEQFTQAFGKQWGQTVMSNTSLSRELLARASAAVNPGVAPLMIDLRPFKPATATPAVSIGLIYLIIMAFFSFAFFLPIHSKYIQPQGHPPLKFWQLIVWRWTATIVAYFLISLAYSLISLAFQLPLSAAPTSPTEPSPPEGATAYGRGTFPVYWMVNFAGMTALGLACENVAMLVGQPWTALWLIFWVITNVSTSFYAIDLSPGFYRWGYAWPGGTSSKRQPHGFTIQDDTDAIRNELIPFVEKCGSEGVIMILHSAGGFIGAGAMKGLSQMAYEDDGKRGGVRQIVAFTAGFLPVGFEHKPLPFMKVNEEKGIQTPVDDMAFFNDMSPEEAKPWIKKFVHHPAEGWGTPIEYAGWQEVPTDYIICESDEIIPAQMQETLASLAEAKVYRLDAGHMAQLSKTEELSQLIVKAIERMQ